MVGIYVRVSTEESAQRGYSILDQIRESRRRDFGGVSGGSRTNQT